MRLSVPPLEMLLSMILRFIQFVFALTVAGLYGVDLHHASEKGVYMDSKWVYAEVCAGLAAGTALIYMIPAITRLPFNFVWDYIMFILWIALFGVFGKMYIKENAEGDSGVQRMKNAVWIDLVNALLWLLSAVMLTAYFFGNRDRRSTFTGRAIV